MHTTMLNHFVQIVGAPVGVETVASALAAWLLVAAFLIAAALLASCADRDPQRRWWRPEVRWPGGPCVVSLRRRRARVKAVSLDLAQRAVAC